VVSTDGERRKVNAGMPVEKYTEDIAVDGSLIQRGLGFVPQYDLNTGWEANPPASPIS
jgi:hypothetical protein